MPGSRRSTRSSKTWAHPVDRRPGTDIGQAIRRINLVAADLELLTDKLRNGRGGLNTDGTIQKLLTQAELHDNFNAMAMSATQASPTQDGPDRRPVVYRQGLTRSVLDHSRGVSSSVAIRRSHAAHRRTFRGCALDSSASS